MKDSLLKDKSKNFALRIIRLYVYLRDSKREYIMSKQLMRCGTSIGANIAEAFYGQSVSDFISKLCIAQKEAAESAYWIELLSESGYINSEQYESIYADVQEMIKLLASSIKTMRQKTL